MEQWSGSKWSNNGCLGSVCFVSIICSAVRFLPVKVFFLLFFSLQLLNLTVIFTCDLWNPTSATTLCPRAPSWWCLIQHSRFVLHLNYLSFKAPVLNLYLLLRMASIYGNKKVLLELMFSKRSLGDCWIIIKLLNSNPERHSLLHVSRFKNLCLTKYPSWCVYKTLILIVCCVFNTNFNSTVWYKFFFALLLVHVRIVAKAKFE